MAGCMIREVGRARCSSQGEGLPGTLEIIKRGAGRQLTNAYFSILWCCLAHNLFAFCASSRQH